MSGAEHDIRHRYLRALCRTVPRPVVRAVLAGRLLGNDDALRFEGATLLGEIVGLGALYDSGVSSVQGRLSQLTLNLSELFETILSEAIDPHDGHVVRFGGDSIAVLFEGDEAASRAVSAASKMQALLVARRDVERDALMLRIAVAAGEVGLRVLGDRSQRVVVCGGQASSTAAALLSATEPGTIVIDAQATEALGPSARLSSVSGGGHRVTSFEVLPPGESVASPCDSLEAVDEDVISALEPFVPPPLASRLRHIPEDWRVEGEVRQAVVVESEVRGIPPWSEHAAAVANTFLLGVRRYGGMIIGAELRATGHRGTSIFGLHAPTENDAERAVLAALDISAMIRNLASEAGLDIELRTGIDIGPVYFGAFGSSAHHAMTVVGEAVDIAWRVRGMAASFEVVATADVVEDLGPEFTVSSTTPLLSRDKNTSLALSVVHGRGGSRARYMQKRRRPRRIASREDELAVLMDAVERGLEGKGQFIGLAGDTGTGKTFLLAPVIDRWLEAGGVGLMGRCRFATRSTPLNPVVGMLSSLLGLVDGDDEPTRERRIRDGLADYALGEAGEELIRFLCEDSSSLHFAPTGELASSDDPRWESIITALERLMAARVVMHPVLCILEDLQHADGLTLRAVRRLTNLSRDGRFFCLTTYRPRPTLGAVRRCLDREILLDNLGLRPATQLVALQLHAERVDEAVAAFLWERTRGNPGQLVELVQFLRDRGLLIARGGEVVAPSPGVSLLEGAVPRGLSQFTLARLESMGPVERRVLRVASSIGRVFEREILERVSQAELDQPVSTAVAKLLDEGLLAPEVARRPSYRFRDDITRAVTYSTIPEAERREMHERVADVVERLETESLDRAALSLAHHRERAGQYREAASWYERAVRVVSSAILDEETCYLVKRWEEIVAELPERERPSQRTVAEMALHRFVATARHFGATEALEQARHIASHHWHHLGREAQATCDLWHGAALLALGELEKARARLSRCYETGTERGLRCDAALRMAKSFWGNDGAVRAWIDRAVAELDSPEGYWAERIDLVRACHHADRGELDEARIINTRVRDSARRGDRLRIAAIATSNLADCDLQCGDVEDARRGFGEAIVMARALGTRTDDAIDQLNLGIAELYAGQPEEARGRLESALATAREIGHQAAEIEALVHFGAAVALTDDLDTGESLVRQGYVRAAKCEARATELAARLHLLHVAILRRSAADIRARLSACEDLAAETRLVPLHQRQLMTLRRRAEECLRQDRRPGSVSG